MNLIQSSFAYGGHDFSVVVEDSIVFAAGNAIVIWNSSTGKKDYIWSKRNGYCQATANYTKNLIAAAEYGLNPEIHIYRFPGKDLVHKFKADTTIRLLDMVFSRDGKYLLMIGGIPDFKICIFDLENNKKINLQQQDAKIPCKPADYKKVKFNPQNNREFAILSNNVVYFYKIHQGYEVTEQDDQKFLGDSERLSFIEYQNENPELQYTHFIWDQYKRIHICTDLPMVLMIDSQTAKEESALSLSARPLALLLTQRHLIISTEDAMISWHRITLPEININDQGTDQKLTVTEDIDQEYKFESSAMQVANQFGNNSEMPVEPIAYMHYSRSFKKIIMSTQQGLIGILAVEAEAINEDEEEEDNQNEKETKVLVTPFVELGRYHTKKINGIKELGETTQLVTISDDQSIAIWEATTNAQIARIPMFSKPTALDVSRDGKAAFIGSERGIFRIFDLSNRAMPRLIKLYRFYDNSFSINSIQCSHDGKYVIVTSTESDQIYIISQQAENEFEVYGHANLEGYIQNSCFAVHEGQLRVVAVLSNSLLAGINLPDKLDGSINRMEPLPESIIKPLYRKIDKGMNLIMANVFNGDIFVCGEDRFLKKYEYPAEHSSKIDFKRASNAPVEELKSHDIGTTCWDISNEIKFLVSGGKDGNFILRNMNHVAQMNEIKGHAIFSGGITALCFSRSRSTLYTAGGDGCFFAWTVGGKPNPSQPIQVQKGDLEAIDKIDQIEDLPEQEIRPFKEILLDQFHKQQAQRKERFREEIMSELNVIKSKLNELLEENERVTDIEKLERDEFVIDVDKRDGVNTEGEKICEEIRKEAEKTTLKLELLKERVQQTTWDKMEVQSKAVKSIKADMLVFNYGIRKRTPEEVRRLMQILNIRRNELREKLARIESKLMEVLDESDFSRLKEGYIMNRVAGKPIYEEDQSIQEAAATFAAKDAEKKSKKAMEEKKLQQAGQQQQQTGKRVPQLKITKGKLGAKTKKIDPNEEAKNAAKDKLQQREIKGMEELYWSVQYALKTLDELKSRNLETLNIWDLIYESQDLYTDPRKRMQIELLREVIFELKRDFNKEFDSLERYKEDQLFLIKEKNEQIKELLNNLKQEEEIFIPQAHFLEDPESIFKVADDEITVEKFLTKEERAKLDEERKKQEERERAMQGDNVGQRGLKTMMGGTELNLKKDQNMIQTELVREDWMNKPYDEMNDEEKLKFKEFEQKEKEFKEKQRKAWEQDLKKIKSEIIEIQLRFEERIQTLFKKKLFFDVRIMEQELYVIRLTIMLHDAKETVVDMKKYHEERDKLEAELKEREEMISTFYNFQQDLETQLRNNNTIQEQEKELKRMFQDVNSKQILNFVKNGRSKKPIGGNQEPSQREQELLQKVVPIDPFSQIDKDKIKQILKEEEEKETYNFEKDNIGLSEEEFDKLVEERYRRIQMEKDKSKLQQQIQTLKDHVSYLESIRNENNEKYQQSFAAHKKASERVEKLKYNYEIVVYLKQGQVEVPQLPVATDYKDAILVKMDVIEEENREIVRRGDAKVKKMESISEFKTGLKKVRYQKKKLDLEITDFEERAKDVQLYRVTKQTQEIIQGKHQKKDEEDKKRLENQIRQLDANAEKRIKTINETRKKLKKEIADKLKENEQLETKARQLQQNVDQRKQIMGLKSNKSDSGVQDPSKKIKEISHKRKLMDIVKQQTEEIEFLRDELDRLRARTFPSFAHLHNKPEYPDEA